ncbi:MAG: PAS domain S-box protein, partial [Gemmatimonadetes bacterium]|nr:PAS domain S-box protein [Gemmatimonadota bacterium]
MNWQSTPLLLPLVAVACLVLGALGGALLRPRRRHASTAAPDGELALQKAFLGHLFEASSEAIVLLDNQDRVVEANAEFIRLFGYPAEAIAGRPINELIVPEELREEGDMLTRQVTSGGRFSVETLRRRR